LAIVRGDQPAGPSVTFDHIVLINSDGTEINEITTGVKSTYDESPTWSPDGKRIAYHRGHGTWVGISIWVVNSDGSGDTKIANGAWPSWSPDGTLIAFTNYESDYNCQIYLVNPDGNGLNNLTSGPHDVFPEWSPDGTIFFVRRMISCKNLTGDIFSIQADGSNLKQLTNYGHVGGFGISPDGKTIAYHDTANKQIMIYKLDSNGPPRSIFNLDFNVKFVRPSWSPDGVTIAIAATNWSIYEGSKLYLVNADGSGFVEVPIAGGVGVWDPVWRP
jgi:Tol biopolymer transport system component